MTYPLSSVCNLLLQELDYEVERNVSRLVPSRKVRTTIWTEVVVHTSTNTIFDGLERELLRAFMIDVDGILMW